MQQDREYDIVVFGATGFTGKLTAEYLARNAPSNLRWGLAGRNRAKLESVRRDLAAINPACGQLALLEADAGDAASIRKIAESTRVVITTVGPYILHGEPLVAACAESGTSYVDLTGEPEFVDLMWLRYHEKAVQTGARLVHCCGFDSIPHDLGAYFTVQQLPEGVPLNVDGFVRASGMFSAGTYHSAIHAFSRLRKYAKVKSERKQREKWPTDRKIGSTPSNIRRDEALGSWVVPFPSVDPQVVRRSAAALERYGPDFRYGHFLQIKKFSTVAGLLGGSAALFSLAQLKPTRNWLLSKKSSGEGPSESQRAKAKFRILFRGEGGGKSVVTEVTGGDPGYGETSKMLAESALSLAFDDLPKQGGQLTPAVAMGNALIDRLMRRDINFRVVSEG